MQVLDLKTGIDFGAHGNLKDYDPVGFAPVPDNISTWTETATAELAFRLPTLRHDLRFTVEVFPYLGGGRLERQDCWIFLNGLFVHYQPVKAPLEMVFTVGRELVNPRANRLSFALPNATSPKDLKLGDDLRLLGLAFVKLSAADASAPAAVAARAPASPAPAGPTRTPATPAPAATARRPAPAPAGNARASGAAPAASAAARTPAPAAPSNTPRAPTGRTAAPGAGRGPAAATPPTAPRAPGPAAAARPLRRP